ncbi:MAG: hypothetical protein ACI8XM_003096 [Haloarculaceae archaeon]|jgi:hypothetical protein
MSAETVREVLAQHVDSPIEVGTYRGVEGVWAKIDLDARIDNSMRPTSLTCTGTVVDEMKVRFVATTAEKDCVLEKLAEIEAPTPADGEVSAEDHDLSGDDELWPHIYYEELSLTQAAKVLSIIEDQPLPVYDCE